MKATSQGVEPAALLEQNAGHQRTLCFPRWTVCLVSKGTRAPHLDPDSVLGILGGSGIIRGVTETEQGFTVEVCGFETVVMDPEVEDVELVPDTTEGPPAGAPLVDAELSGVSGVFWDPSVRQGGHPVRGRALTCATLPATSSSRWSCTCFVHLHPVLMDGKAVLHLESL